MEHLFAVILFIIVTSYVSLFLISEFVEFLAWFFCDRHE